MDLRLLEYFAAVADELNFGRAAERLYVTTPAVSAGVRRLEHDLGVELFHRNSRSVQLTEAGHRLLPHALELLAASGRIEELAHGLRGTVTITAGTFWGLGADVFMKAAEQLRILGVEVRTELRVFGWDDPTGGLRSRQADLAVVPGPTEIDDELVRRHLWSERRVAVLPGDHPLADSAAVCVADLDAAGWLRFPIADPVAHPWWRLDHVRGGPPPESGRVHQTPQELLIAVRSGQGITTTVESFRDQFAFTDLRLVPIADAPEVPVEVAYRREGATRLIHRFAQLVQHCSVDTQIS